MATLLYRLGRGALRRRRLVVALWLVVLVVAGLAAATLRGPTASNFTMPGTESQRALDLLADQFPAASGATGTIAVKAPADGQLATPQGQAVVQELVQQASALPGVVGAVNPLQVGAVSPNGRYALVQVQFATGGDEVTDEQRTAYEEVGAAAKAQGWQVAPGGEVLGGEPEIGSTEALGVLVAAIVLIITFGSLVAAGMTMLNALIGVGVGMAGLFALSGVIELTSTAPILALMLGLAVGIDYSLFITSRHRQNLLEGLSPEEAVGRAVGTAGSAVVFAGATVVIALAGLAVVNIPFLTVMGLAAAGTVTIAVLVAITLQPALLGFAGNRVLPRRLRSTVDSAAPGEPVGEETLPVEDRSGFGFRWARFVTRFRVPVILVSLLGLGLLALPTPDMRLALPDASTATVGSPARVASDLTTEGFGPGFTGRLAVVVAGDDAQATAAAVPQVTAMIQRTENVVAVAPPQLSPDGRTALLGVVPKTGPTDEATETLVHDVRDAVGGVKGAEVLLTGATAIGIDVSEKLSDALPIYLLLVVGLSVLLLMLVFRSLLVPLKAALGFLLTVAATFGITVAIFQQGHLADLVGLDTPAPLVSFLPILLIGILFGLAMDYEVFLVSRMREDFVHGETAREATISGMGHGARVVTAAALIMMSVFGGFVFLDDPIIKSMGFALAIGVAIDAFVVRMTIVPAVMSLLGDRAWWLPRWLNRALPNVDIEGEGLREHLEDRTPTHV
ncbi:MMPL family transporter [Micromonospora saelicesensis]|uniref:Membrane protein YdfJ n=1 Tax=Micromonospora saelicesensis TaxID=285676 RepID=A0A1C4ZIJ8_9ACTN|nr:MMPL family transporter [Micromonospora saelicesensis]RAN98079.1 Membrane protein YdfJ [Micromonospora saelicesensis]RAO32266.1 Membrane protein YdfJ [Micromonospora saelicesensis]RAO41011.1 Membrane protein YdfJ [Micromonospora saelicesensis]RAO45485.1 Membrane protein YdfJ [Micromonospora saelicesensis]RAO53694.1 Membrane protein YdfJ [Micromonospora saelicesensis]